MAIRIYKSITPGTRNRSVADFTNLTKKKPEKSLLAKKMSKAGRNNSGGGAGGYRTLAGKTFSITSGTSFPITVGAGGTGAPNPASPEVGVSGSNSIFSTITSAGGGGGGGAGNAGPHLLFRNVEQTL